jgi:hypothetical protein
MAFADAERSGRHPPPNRAPAFRSVFFEQVLERRQHVHIADDPEHVPRSRLDDLAYTDLVLETVSGFGVTKSRAIIESSLASTRFR